MDVRVKLLILLATSLLIYSLIVLLKVLYDYWWVPLRIQHFLNSQGLRGPPYKFIHGCNKQINKMRSEALSKPMGLTHDILPRVFPHYYSWINLYGKNYLSWDGAQAQVVTVGNVMGRKFTFYYTLNILQYEDYKYFLND
ncbi:hypothetical protein E1A91_A10G138500v1 [Gossypium mustelinum]|uniref:Cytochrome P450 n=1 Tax=Gossypium mustelinum TaxID=34275 RepID=A0A5D2XLB5_GOSMU|nr:hypothetical protein E1A91_A10G138500v1 [Gossypium mustelinum]